MLFREIIAVYCENHTEHTDTLCGQNAGLLDVNAGGAYSYQRNMLEPVHGPCCS
jgi:hypothetical protein